MRISVKILRLMSLLWMPAVGLIAGETAEAPSPLPKTVAVAAFKNGLAFVLRQGEIPLSRGIARIAPIPSATLGTLWLAPGNADARIDEVVAYRYNIAGQRLISSLGDVLRANAGKTVTVTYQMKEYTGEVVAVKEPDSRSSTAPGDASVRPREDYLLLKMNSRLMALPLGGISMANLPEDAVLRESVERPSQALRLTVKGGGMKEKMTMGYLEHGFGWTPSYLISLIDDTNAQITMQSVVTNDAEDVENAELFFVVGVPNFAYADTLSPMSLQQSLVDYMKDAERDYDRKKSFGALSNAISGQALMMDEKEAIGGPISLTGGVDEMASAPEEDLFLYRRSDVTLAKGERASYNVFSGSVSYEHLYNWEVEDQPRVDAFGNVMAQNQNVQDGNKADSVWHAIRLKNATKFPWTSAPALVMAGEKPVSQDTLSYTPKGASSTLKITVATDIRASHEEREVSRQQELTRRRGYNYDLVTVEGRLKLKNYKSKAVHLAIGKTLRGKTEFQSDEGKSMQLGEGIESDNPRSRLTWDLKLQAGEERVVTYRYKIWVRA